MEVGRAMLENIFETVIVGSNNVFLNVPDEDYFIKYHEINDKAAEEIAVTYFEKKGRRGIPMVQDVDHDEYTHKVQINIQILQSASGDALAR